MTAWQHRCINTVKGRSTKGYCEEVKVRLESEWVLDHYDTQYLTGHGHFKAKLFGFGLVDDPNCTHCKVEETIEHVLWDCMHYILMEDVLLKTKQMKETQEIT